MPCRDYYDDHPDHYFKDVTEPALKKQISFAESALCGALAALREVYNDTNEGSPGWDANAFYDAINYKEMGLEKAEVIAWHKNHMALDAKHRAEEAEKKRLKQLRADALAKLTPEEKKVLGIE